MRALILLAGSATVSYLPFSSCEMQVDTWDFRGQSSVNCEHIYAWRVFCLDSAAQGLQSSQGSETSVQRRTPQSSPVSRRAWGEYSLLIKFSAFESFWVTFSHLTNHKWQGSVISTRWQRVYKVHHGTSLLPSARKSKCSTNMLSQSILVLRISPGRHRLERENSLHWT